MFRGLGISGLGFSLSEIEEGCEVYKLDGVRILGLETAQGV